MTTPSPDQQQPRSAWTCATVGVTYPAEVYRAALAEVAQLRSDLAHAQAGQQAAVSFVDVNNQAIAALTAERDQLCAQLAARDSQVATLQAVIEASKRVAAGWGHNMPGWAACAAPGNCPWEALNDALAALDQAQQRQQEAL